MYMFAIVLLILVAKCSLQDVGGFHNLYPEAVCKLHICCIRMNIIFESLAKGRGIACIGRKVIRVCS